MVFKFPCSICEKSVNKNHKALQCDICDSWVHIRCCFVSPSQYLEIQNENLANPETKKFFYCHRCINKILPFGDINSNVFSNTNSLGMNQESETIQDINVTLDSQTKKQMKHISDLIKETNPNNSCCRYYDVAKFIKLLQNNPTSFKGFHLNIASLQFHFSELQQLIKSTQCEFDFIGITETKIRSGIKPITSIDLPGYTYQDTPTLANKGGTLLYISDRYNYIPRKDLQINVPGQVESTFVELVLPNEKNKTLGVIYKHHTISQQDFISLLNPLLIKLKRENKPTILMGDFNMDLLKINKEPLIEQYYDNLTYNHFMPLITSPTRISQSSKTLIDNIFINRYIDGTLSGNLTVGISDHLPQFCFIPQGSKPQLKNKIKLKRDFKKFDHNSFLNDLNNNLPNENLDVIQYTNAFCHIIDQLLDQHAPLRKMNYQELKRDEKPWITRDILKKIQKKDRHYKKFIKESEQVRKVALNERIKAMKNEITKLIRRNKTSHYKEYFLTNSNNTKKLWSGINEIIHTKPQKSPPPKCITQTINKEIKNVTDHKEIAQIFNDYYCQVAEKLLNERKYNGNKPFYTYLKDRVDSSFMMIAATPDEVNTIIQNMDTTKSTGPHSIPTKIIKMIGPAISVPISEICNKSFLCGTYPDILKISRVIPIFKKDSRLDVENYRPISLISNINKIIEKMMFSRLNKFLESKNVFYKLQFGFRAKNSTNHAILSMIQQLRSAMEKGETAIGVIVDFKKAFDTVNHKILLKKLEHYGVRGIANDWFKSYLSERKQFVSIEGAKSSLDKMVHGVPQGSVLGPLLFLIYINDLNQCIKNSTTRHFADDTSLVHIIGKKTRNRNPFRKLNVDLKSLTHWLLANKIALNATKTEVVVFRRKSNHVPNGKIVLNGKKLDYESHTKYIGIILDEYLTFQPHRDILNAKLKRACNLLSISRHYVPKEILLQIYYAQFHSHLNYCCQIWALTANLAVTTALQKKAMRIITFSQFNTPAEPLFKGLRILQVKDIAKLQNLLLVHDTVNGLAPKHFENYFTPVSRSHAYYTVNNPTSNHSLPIGFVKMPLTSNRQGELSVKATCAKDWNEFLRCLARQSPESYQKVIGATSREHIKKMFKLNTISNY